MIVALFGVGFLIRRHGRQLAQRLGLEKPKPIHLLFGVGWIVLLVVLQAIAGAAWALLNPEQAELLENVNNLLLADVDTVWEWFLLALAPGIGEELLFRGALQPVLGLGFTAVLFGLVHVQYGYTPVRFPLKYQPYPPIGPPPGQYDQDPTPQEPWLIRRCDS